MSDAGYVRLRTSDTALALCYHLGMTRAPARTGRSGSSTLRVAASAATALLMLGAGQAAAAAPLPAPASPASPAAKDGGVGNPRSDHHLRGYKLVFRDEFGGKHLDRSTWCTRYQFDGGAPVQVPDPTCLGRDPVTGATLGTLDTLGGDGTSQGQESQVYRDFNRDGRKMHTVQHGYLSLHATATRLDQPFLKYESAMIRSKREFRPTTRHPLYLTARVRQPDVLGTWPAFWLASGYGDGHVRPPWPPEIDILEGPLNDSGQYANVLHVAVHSYGCDGPCPQGPFDFTFAAENFDTTWSDYHASESLKDTWIEVGLEWHPDHVCWYLDGLKFACQLYKWVANAGPESTTPATVLLNLAVGGPWAGADGVDDAKFPTRYDIDHVRVYRK
jgi:Glycosyl hydrolases family 16